MQNNSMLEYIAQGMEDNLFDFTKDGECSNCGECCSNLLPMSEKEIRTIHKYIKKYKIKESKHLIPLAKGHYDMTCPFRDNDNKICTIYQVRPQICKSFTCNNEKRAKRDRKLLGQTRKVVAIREEFYGDTI